MPTIAAAGFWPRALRGPVPGFPEDTKEVRPQDGREGDENAGFPQSSGVLGRLCPVGGLRKGQGWKAGGGAMVTCYP